ncbi:MAG: hypothetical protein R6X27_04310 [Candidatus Desulfacyla sp.]
MVATFLIDGMEIFFPIAVVAMLPTLMSINRVVTMSSHVGGKPWIYSSLIIPGCVIVAKVIMAIVWPPEETVGKDPEINHKRWPEKEARSEGDTEAEGNRRKEHASIADGIVPVASDKDITARRPDVIVWHPDPVRPHDLPMTGPPGIPPMDPYPTAGYPNMVR